MTDQKKLAPLGFGFMRLPMMNDAEGNEVIDIEKTKELVDIFMEGGFSYFDTARSYIVGKSESALRQTLVERYPRDSFQVASKLPAWMARSTEHAQAMFGKSMRELGVEYFDYYLLHNLGNHLTRSFDKYDIWNFTRQKKEEGLIRNLGFSIHDSALELERVLKEHPEMDFVQLQINWADWESETVQARQCYEVAREHDKPVVIMEPVKGGSLVRMPDAVADVLKEAEPGATLASWALRFAGSLDGVIAVLSGMGTVNEVAENVATMAETGRLTEAEHQVIDEARRVLDGMPGVPCTDCRYCEKGCERHIAIPVIMNSLNIYDQFGDKKRAQENYDWYAASNPPSTCIACGECEEVCPQHISIINELERASDLFE